MKIIIKATQIELTPPIYEYIEEKFGSLNSFVKKFEINSEVKMEVEIGKPSRHHRRGNVFYAEANLYLPGKVLRAEHFDWDIRVAIDNVKDKLRQEVKKYKSKQEVSRRKGAGMRGKE